MAKVTVRPFGRLGSIDSFGGVGSVLSIGSATGRAIG